jgi:hypothetical protein
VTSKPLYSKKYKRWPWYVTASNQTTHFGRNWALHNIYVKKILERYMTKYPKRIITKVGGSNLGALNFGKDKIKLDPDFAKYIINKVTMLNSRTRVK